MTPPLFLLPDWPAPPGIGAATTTRAGGVSHLDFASLNLAAHVGDSADAVATNREILVRELALPEMPVWLSQVHGIEVLRLDGQTAAKPSREYDACYSNLPGKVCAVLTADCLPVLFCSQDGQEVAAAHAGWRGLVDGVLETTARSFASPPDKLLAWLGPAIGPASFEVGEEVLERFLHQWRDYGKAAVAACFMPARPQHWHGDLYALARLQLHKLGIASIHGGGEDTCADWQRFYSYRRDGDTGRMATLIWRKE